MAHLGNRLEKLYIIGDVHGCYDTLMALIEKLLDPNPKLVFVGDLVDRGNRSAQVIEFVKSNNYDCVIGNHEIYMLEALRAKSSFADDCILKDRLWKENGGSLTLKSYHREDGAISIKEHYQWLENLPHYLKYDIKDEEGRTLLVTHGVGLPFYDMLDACKEEITTNRTMIETEWNNVVNVFGHSPFKDVKFYLNYIGIDTGCIYGKKGKEGYLTAIEWPSKKIYQQAYIG